MRDDNLKVEKRNRPPKSCDPCRLRKMKCNRTLPCDTCVRRGKSSSCQYASNADRSNPRATNKVTVIERLRNLENMVVALGEVHGHQGSTVVPPPLAGQGQSTTNVDIQPTNDSLLLTIPGPAVPTVASVQRGGPPSQANTHVIPQTRSQKGFYVDPSHWSSLLEDIRHIRDELSPSHTSIDEETWISSNPSVNAEGNSAEGTPNSDLVFGAIGPLDITQILENLPSRSACDRLVSHYFRARHALLPIVHPVKFQRDYVSFWEAPQSASPIWIALLFAILSLAKSMSELSGTSHGAAEPIPSAKLLSRATEQCLVFGGYARAREHCLEVLLVHLQSCYIRSKDSDLNLWLFMGVIIRLALKMGYHRDPAKLPKAEFSPFESEMRRRVWATIFQIDTLMSFQMGHPSMIPVDCCDVELPRNLENSDFCPETVVLPEARPVTDCTPVLYTIAKASVMSMFRAVVSHTRSLASPPYDQTLALDEQLRNAYSNIPPALKYVPISQSIVDSPGIIMDRTTIEILHLKSIIVLHRQYITACRENPLFNTSRSACLQAVESVLSRQVELHEATQPGCQLYDQKWMVSALTTNDFILAAMVLCLELTIRTQRPSLCTSSAGKGPNLMVEDPEFARYFQLLQQSQRIFAGASDSSAEARVASEAISSTVRMVADGVKLRPGTPRHGLHHPTPGSYSGVVEARLPPNTQIPTGMIYGETPYVDWGVLDNPLQEPLSDALDLESWIMEALEASGPVDP